MERRLIIAAIVLVLAIAPFVSAAVVNPTGLTDSTPETRDMSSIGPQSVEAQAGNITAVNIEALTVTNAWQGYYGNISGGITLDDANNNTFYNWTLTTTQGEVYASRVASPDWDTIACASSGERTAEDTYLAKAAADADSATLTFAGTNSHPQFNVSTTEITGDTCYSTNAYIDSGLSATDFYQIMLADGSSNIVYTTIIDDGQTAFNTGAADFELLVAENGKTDAGSTPYYFFVELD